MKRLMILCLVLVLAGCAGSVTPVCQHMSVFGAYTDAVEGNPVRIVCGPSGPTVRHCQHQAWINGKWEWRCYNGFVWFSCQQDRYWPDTQYTFKGYLDRTLYRKRTGTPFTKQDR